MNRPAHFSDADWAEYQQCQAENDDLMEQVAERQAQLEHDQVDGYEFDFTPLPGPNRTPTRQPPSLHRAPASRRRNRGR
ncbi:hypothetical protein [Streptomyces sp. NPDC018352]|uniref:hypothetical protein n=1 Tax=Streptomyces sp. NPDC018352 TaxID=3157194 RepID=UPI0033ECC9E7